MKRFWKIRQKAKTLFLHIGLQKIAREFLARADGRLFYDPHPDTAEDWQPHAGMMPGDVARMLAAMFAKYPILDWKDG